MPFGHSSELGRRSPPDVEGFTFLSWMLVTSNAGWLAEEDVRT